MDESNHDELTEMETRFLDSVRTGSSDGIEDDHPEETSIKPGFPWKSTIVVIIMMALTMAFTFNIMSTAAQYSDVLSSEKVQTIMKSSDDLQSLSIMSDAYSIRWAIYAGVIIIYAIIEGLVLLTHWYHVRRWSKRGSYDE